MAAISDGRYRDGDLGVLRFGADRDGSQFCGIPEAVGEQVAQDLVDALTVRENVGQARWDSNVKSLAGMVAPKFIDRAGSQLMHVGVFQ